MSKALVNAARCRLLRDAPSKTAARNGGGSVLYWMSRDQRVQDNWALLKALEVARESASPMAIVFCMTRGFPGATYRAYDFMLHGLSELEETCASLKIPFFLLDGEPPHVLPKFAADVACSTLITDFSPMPIKKIWQAALLSAEPTAKPLPAHVTRVIEVDAHNVVPLWIASDKREHAARTIRPKITAQLPKFLTDFPAVTPQLVKECVTVPWPSDFPQPAKVGTVIPAFRDVLNVDRSVAPVSWIVPGERAALAAATAFATSNSKMAAYAEKRNDPVANAQSQLSPYLHFGQLAPQRAAFLCLQSKANFNPTARQGADGFIEELVVRRELSDNYVYYSGLTPDWPAWAVETLKMHEKDKREHLYTQDQLERSETYDDLWNAAQLELVALGKLHGFMRMYWAKKILEWSSNAETAYNIALHFNDKYSLDGRDPNGNVGVAWSIYGVHDMGWTERSVFGKVRYMNYAGCKRKFDIPAYIARVKRDVAAETKKQPATVAAALNAARGASAAKSPAAVATVSSGSSTSSDGDVVVVGTMPAAKKRSSSTPPASAQQPKRPQPRPKK